MGKGCSRENDIFSEYSEQWLIALPEQSSESFWSVKNLGMLFLCLAYAVIIWLYSLAWILSYFFRQRTCDLDTDDSKSCLSLKAYQVSSYCSWKMLVISVQLHMAHQCSGIASKSFHMTRLLHYISLLCPQVYVQYWGFFANVALVCNPDVG